ncbi:complement receptor type 1 [Pantherophis guttatus]|uniref:Complement receptor type 1 n=1 Tax=Pantherophis guttatus TaxID=94885 RepID=A0ABM3ZAY9_PANGU|nr:complement receptor type 1 [Pantherophis guttatus]
MSSAISFIVITETRAMISVCTLSLSFAATFLAAPLVNQDSCDYPPRLVSAELTDEYKEKDFFPVGSTVKYKCRPGYVKKPGAYSSTCNTNQQWSKVQELCKRKTCGHPGEPEGGRLLVTGDFDLGSTAIYQCDEGYRLIGKSTRKCKVRDNKMEWTDEVPFCEIIPCLPPPKIPHGRHNGEYLDYFYYATVVIYRCDKGYPLIGNDTITCTSKDGINGEWSGPCVLWSGMVPISSDYGSMPTTPDIQNGIRSNQETGVFPSGIFVKYTCNPGYALIGEATLRCTNAGRWSSPAPNCEVVQCQPPPDIQNGTRSNQETTVFPSGMLVTYTCNPGHALIGEATIQCIDNGMWSSPAPNCEGGSCGIPIRLDFADLTDAYQKMNSFPVGSLVQYKCNPGYFKHPRVNASSICIRNQVWSEVPEFCIKKSCGHPGEPENGRLIVSGDFLFGSTLSYTCEEGYKLIGQSSRKCALNGKRVKWSGNLPECQPILCSSPPNIPHGKHTGNFLKDFFYGTTVTYMCDKGYPLIGNASITCTSKDGINGEWSGRAYCGVAWCQSPQIKNGKIVAGVSSTYKYNQKVSFECIGGHEMVGSREIHCQVDGTWDPPMPVCEQVVQCPPPPDIQNGIRSNQETGVFPSGIFVKYTCNPGYALIGEATLRCTNAGRWSSPAPNCEGTFCDHNISFYKLLKDGAMPATPNIQNGTRSNQETTVFPSGMLVTYTCNPGYALIGEATIQCIDNGMWSSPAPNCEGGSCGIPIRLDFADLTDAYQKMNSFPVGSLVQYKCNPGYFKHPRVNASSICIRNQVWSEVPEFCISEFCFSVLKNRWKYSRFFECVVNVFIKKSCGHPGEPENGRLIVSGDFLFGSTLSYTCEEGYKLIGQSSRKCALNGKRVKWSGNLPECQPILCSSPPNIPHGKHTGQILKDFFYGTTVTYMCDKGYPLIGNASITCTSKDGINGEWSGRAYCGVARCQSPQIKNGKIVAGVSSTYKYNQKVSFECIGDHKMVGSREIYCQVDGTWDPPTPVCEFVVQCPPPPDIQNGTCSNQETGVFSSGILVTYTCNPGYALIGKATLHCTNAGKWSSPAPNCEGKSCGHPGELEGGRLLVTGDFRFGSTVNYQCEEGYRLIGKSSRSCALFGETVAWTGDLPYCQIVQCQPPPDIQNGIHSNQETLFSSGTLVKYTCNPGYALIGEATIQCMDNGRWSSPVPNCEEIECKSPPDIQNGVHSNQEVIVFKRGMYVKYTCNFGYTLIGDATIHCADSGTWTFPAPHCEKSQCSFPPSIANGKHDGLALQMFTFKMSVTYSCDPGYLLIGKASIFCGPSGNWSLPVPSCEDMETTKLPSDSQVTKDGNNQIEKITGSFIKNTIHSEINKTTTKDLATTLTPGLGGESNIQRLPEQLNGGNQTDRLNGGNQTDAFPEVRNCSGEVDGCPLPPLSDSTEAETNSVIQTSANVILECENGYVRNDSSPIQAQQIGQDAPVPACVQSKQDSYSFATIGFGSLGSILLLLLIFGGVMWIVLLQKKKHNCTCEAQRRYCVASYEDSPL